MNCPYCNRKINALTGFQEIEKFSKHLKVCLKNPERKIISERFGEPDGFNFVETINVTPSSIKKALEIRALSGQ